eukprot:7024922-Pyramimonas_sp.AAC.1
MGWPGAPRVSFPASEFANLCQTALYMCAGLENDALLALLQDHNRPLGLRGGKAKGGGQI